MERLEKFSELIKISPDFLFDSDIDNIKSTVSDKNVLDIRKILKNFFEYFKKDVYNYDFQNHNDKSLQEIVVITAEAKKNCKGIIDESLFDFFLKEVTSLFEFVENETKRNANFVEHIFMKKILRIQKILILLGFDPMFDIPIKDQTKLILYIGGSIDEVTADKQAITDYSTLGIITCGLLNKCVKTADSIRKKESLSSANKDSFVEILCPNSYMNCLEYFKFGSLLYLNYIKLFRLKNTEAKMYLAVGHESFVIERTVPIEIKYLDGSEKVYDYYHPNILLLSDTTDNLGELEIVSSFIPDIKMKITLQQATDMRFSKLKPSQTVDKYSLLELKTPKYFLLHNTRYKEDVAHDGFFNTSTLYLSDGKPIIDRAELLECQKQNKAIFMHLDEQAQLLLNFKHQREIKNLEKCFDKWKEFVIYERSKKVKIRQGTNTHVTEDIEISELVPTMAGELYDVIDKNREHLKQHLVWIDKIQNVSDELKFINSIDRSNRDAFVIINKGKIIGVIDYTKGEKQLDIGYWIAKDYEGKGIITKCCQKIIEHGFIDLKLEKITIHMDASNPKSEAVAKRLGFKFTGIEESDHQKNLLGKNRYEMLLKDFQKLQTIKTI
ncbi:MAG TPA: GNAT family protein [Rickettsiales bacterium]|nr:GNAT family protein [Rickettsiales bacterium]